MQGYAENKQSLFDLITGYRASHIIYSSVKLGLFDCLYKCNQDIGSLSGYLLIKEEKLLRLIKCLIAIDLIGCTKDKKLFITDLGLPLAKNHSKSVQNRVLFHGDLACKAWGSLHKVFDNDESAFEIEFGKDFFSYLNENHDALENFNSLMGNVENEFVEEILDSYEFLGKKIVDIGGGAGFLASTIAQFYNDKEVTIFDLPPVIKKIENNKINNLFYESGNFFCSVPTGDLYILKRVLHDWNDEDALKIIQTCKKNIKSDGKIIVIENLYTDELEDKSSCWLDINMMVLFNSQERTINGYKKLMEKAGLDLYKDIVISESMVLMEFV